MATTTFTCNKDTRIARRESDNASFGAGASDYLPVGLYSGYRYRSLLGFSYSFAGMTSITSAVLHVKTSSQFYVAFGSDPDLQILRITESWSEGNDVGLSTTAATEWSNQPNHSSANDAFMDISPAENTWDTVDITAMMQDALAAGVFYGLKLVAWNGSSESDSSTDVTEIYAREYGSNDAYITVTYTTNTVPSAPTAMSPTGGTRVAGTTPTLAFTHVDGQSDPLLDYDLQVSTDSTFASVTHWNIAAQTTGISGNNVSLTYAGTALSRGTTYYWRARTSASTGELGEGTWSAAQQFKVNQLPTSTLDEPSAAGRLGKLSYTAGSGWAAPRLNVTWTFVDPDVGDAQSAYQVLIQNDLAGSPDTTFHDSTKTAGAANSYVVPTTLTEGNYYHVTVTTWDGSDESVAIGPRRIRVRWGFQQHRFDVGSTPSSWSISTLNAVDQNSGGSGLLTIEYGSDTAANATPVSGWKGTFGEIPTTRYFYYRVWLMTWGASPATSPHLDKMVLSYTATALVPDKWTREDVTNATIDLGTFVYGTQSLKLLGKGSMHNVYQLVPVVPNTNYVLSGRLKSSGTSNVRFCFSSGPTSGLYGLYAGFLTSTTDWTRYSTTWNSGSNTEVYIRVLMDGAAGTTGWADALKLEASTVVTPWTPSFLGKAVVLDAGGLQIDASTGHAGIFRLRASAGGTRDRVDLGAKGLDFGGDVSVYSDTAGILSIDGGAAAVAAKPPVVHVYTANDTWTKPSDIQYIVVEVVGGGGGGGGITASATAGHGSTGSGGGGGGYARKLFTAADLAGDTTFPVTVPAAAAGGNSASGAAGGTCSFDATGAAAAVTVQATGGGGGTRGLDRSGNNIESQTGGGQGSGGDVNAGGTAGVAGIFTGNGAAGGDGGASPLGGGAAGPRTNGGSAVGNPGKDYGGGGSGAVSLENATNRAGGDGAVGCVIVTEYYGP